MTNLPDFTVTINFRYFAHLTIRKVSEFDKFNGLKAKDLQLT